ncbi:Crp/Fnr family transcriptional regulator [Rhodoferax sp.]|uniref:Crp/Fnr family transcriptional regulator n=1 Tax=Rhodoferax sp. TaxID=50421 RepID=UPI002770EC03|nr:Crp/Fnr family transcriptional regulator [Rhodoferax sp.]
MPSPTEPVTTSKPTPGTISPLVRALMLRGAMRSYARNAIVISEGDVGDSLFVLTRGSVKVFCSDAEGRELTYGTITTGDYFGEMSLDGGPRSASVMALENCSCAVIPGAAVKAYMLEVPEFALALLTQVIHRARTATDAARGMALLDVYGRVIALLEGIHGVGNPDEPVEIQPVTHQDIANRVGASREMVSRLLKDLEKGGHITLGVRRITLLKKLPAHW